MTEQASQRRGRSRRQKADRKADAGFTPSTRDQVLSLPVIERAGTAAIHGAVLKILEEIGVVVEHAPALKTLVEAGGRPGDDGYLRMPSELVQRAISTVPERIRLYDQNGRVRIDTGGTRTSYCPGHNCVRILDYQTGALRPDRLEDIKHTAIVSDKLPNLDSEMLA